TVVLTVNHDDLLLHTCPWFPREVLLDGPIPNLQDRYSIWHLCGYVHTADPAAEIRLVPSSLSTPAVERLRLQVRGMIPLFLGFDDEHAEANVSWVVTHLCPPLELRTGRYNESCVMRLTTKVYRKSIRASSAHRNQQPKRRMCLVRCAL